MLHRCLEQAIKLWYLKTNPLNAVTLSRIEKQPLEDDQLAEFLNEIRGSNSKMYTS